MMPDVISGIGDFFLSRLFLCPSARLPYISIFLNLTPIRRLDMTAMFLTRP